MEREMCLAGFVVAVVSIVTTSVVPAPVTAEVSTAGDLSSLIVVGGPVAVSESVASQAGSIAEIAPSRQSGANRYATAAAVATATFPTGVNTVYLTTGEGFADALSASTALASGRAALLLTTATRLPAETTAALGQLSPTQVIVIGGPSAISEGVLAEVRAASTATVSRISGPNRYATSAEVSRVAFPSGSNRVYLATGTGFADALAASSALAVSPAVLLLTDPNSLPAVISSELDRLNPSQVFIIGGAAAVSDTVVAQVAAVTGVTPVRLAGSNRYDTARRVSEHAYPDRTRNVYLTTGQGFADALSAAQAVIVTRASLLLTETGVLPLPTGQEIARLARTSPPGGLSLTYASTSFSTSQISQTRAPTVTGASGALSFSFTGTLPTGVTFNTSTGVFTGPGAWNFEAVQIAAGRFHTCAVTTGGAAKCWGLNSDGRLGDGSTTTRLTPVDVVGLGTGVASISAGSNHTCAVTTGGAVKCWGSNGDGRLGDGSTTTRLTPVDVTGLGSGVASVAAGDQFTCAVTTAGAAKCWGLNAKGRLGDGSLTTSLTPVDVVGLGSGVVSISAYESVCVVITGGSMKCWGANNNGTLGDGTLIDRLTPVDVVGLGSSVASISVGPSHSCAVTTGGAVKCWGSNNNGKVGDGTTTQRLNPVDVVGLGSGVASVSASSLHTCAVTTGGAAKCWGDNGNGQLGDGTTTQRSTPVDVVGLGSGVASISAGERHTCTVITGGAAKCWGVNGVGDGTATQRLTPVDVVGSGNPGWPASINVTVTDSAGSASVTVTLTKS